MGYYTEVAGLGALPTDVVINGTIDVYNQCFATGTPGTTNCIALDNFWRSLSNLTINIAGKSGCQSGTNVWGVSQAAPMRRVNITGGDLSLMDNCSADPQFASGGFIADCQTTRGTIINGSQHDSDNVLLDDIWAWRADHGNGVGWILNTADTGLIVNGDIVTAYGLFVEHFQKFEVIWNGENGRTIMFRNEMPYDPPDQAAWMHDGIDGYAAYKVRHPSKRTEDGGWAATAILRFNTSPAIQATRALAVPNTPGVQLHDILTVFLNGYGRIDNVVNNAGGPTGRPALPRI